MDQGWNPIFRQFPVEYITPEQEAILDKRSAELTKTLRKGTILKVVT